MSGATVVRGVLNLSSIFDCRFPIALRDISGRKVMELRPGPNDVRGLSAGVYFLQSTIDNRQSEISRVVVAR